MYLYLYEIEDWNYIIKLLDLKKTQVASDLAIPWRSFLNITNAGKNPRLSKMVKFTKYIDEVSIDHRREYLLPKKEKIIDPLYFGRIKQKKGLTLRGIQSGMDYDINYVTVHKYVSEFNDGVDFHYNATKKISNFFINSA